MEYYCTFAVLEDSSQVTSFDVDMVPLSYIPTFMHKGLIWYQVSGMSQKDLKVLLEGDTAVVCLFTTNKLVKGFKGYFYILLAHAIQPPRPLQTLPQPSGGIC